MKSLPIVLAAALLIPAATASAAVTPPTPSGPAPVGFTRTTLTDHQRTEPLAGDTGARRVPLRVWYPAAARSAAPAAVLTPAEQAELAGGVGLPASALDGLGSAATAAAPAAPGRHPVLLLSPGLNETTALQSAHAADLASHGYVVVGVDIVGETYGLDLGDGQTTPVHITEASAEIDRAAHARPAVRARQARVGAWHRPDRPRPRRRVRALQRRRDRRGPDARRPPDPRRCEHGRRHLRPRLGAAVWTGRSGS